MKPNDRLLGGYEPLCFREYGGGGGIYVLFDRLHVLPYWRYSTLLNETTGHKVLQYKES